MNAFSKNIFKISLILCLLFPFQISCKITLILWGKTGEEIERLNQSIASSQNNYIRVGSNDSKDAIVAKVNKEIDIPPNTKIIWFGYLVTRAIRVIDNYVYIVQDHPCFFPISKTVIILTQEDYSNFIKNQKKLVANEIKKSSLFIGIDDKNLIDIMVDYLPSSDYLQYLRFKE